MRYSANKILSLFFLICLLTYCVEPESISNWNVSENQLINSFPYLTGEYLGQNKPGTTPEIFAKGIVSTSRHEHSFPTFSPDGKQVLWTSVFQENYSYEFPMKVISSEILYGEWSEPDFFQGIPLNNSYEAFFSPYGERVYFTSTSLNPDLESSNNQQDIWYVEKIKTGWSVPKNIGFPVNTSNIESKPTVTKDLTLYFVGHYDGGKNNYGIYKSELKEGSYQTPQLLPKNINTEDLDWTPFIAPDESYLLFSSFREGGFGSGDLYISYRNSDNTWTDPLNLGPKINGTGNERYPYVSPDGKYLFFVSDRVDLELLDSHSMRLNEYSRKYLGPGNGWGDVYWVDAKVLPPQVHTP